MNNPNRYLFSDEQLPAVTADFFVEIPMEGVDPGKNVVEGLIFDRQGFLYVLHVPAGKVYRINIETREISLFIQMPKGMVPAAIKIHKDGRLFIPVIASEEGSCIAIYSPNGNFLDTIVRDTGRLIDDMVFDRNGGFYFTDLGGTIENPTAGVIYVDPDHKTLKPIISRGMVATNGIALDPEGNNLWVTEYGAGKLHYIKLINNKFNVRPLAAFVPYHFTGLDGPDSCCIDADGNLYVAMTAQGRCLIFSPNGFPVRQILLPGRENGAMLKSTHIMLRPETHEVYICSADLKTGKSAIFRAEGLAKAHRSYQFL